MERVNVENGFHKISEVQCVFRNLVFQKSTMDKLNPTSHRQHHNYLPFMPHNTFPFPQRQFETMRPTPAVDVYH